MAPDPGRTYTVGVSFEKLIPDEGHKSKIRDAVERVHRATIYAPSITRVRRAADVSEYAELGQIRRTKWEKS